MLAAAHISSLGYLWSNQPVVYNDHKGVHALKFQAVTLPNGLIANIYGPVGKPQIFFLFTKKPFFLFSGMFMEFFFHFTCLLLLPYFLVKLFSIINNSLYSFLFSRHIPSLLVICKPCMTRF